MFFPYSKLKESFPIPEVFEYVGEKPDLVLTFQTLLAVTFISNYPDELAFTEDIELGLIVSSLFLFYNIIVSNKS